ncbi:MAG: hypothetical protein L0H70_08350 [Xanthomonadales bacterium]|nr:hypothetical protein [Xanthomonadales bacterium]
MKTILCFSLALCGALLSTSALAANQTTPRNMASVHAEQATQQTLRAHYATHASVPGVAAVKSANADFGSFGGANGPYANPFRAYPPSCVADPLPSTPSGPMLSKDIDLAAYVPAQGGFVRETATVTLWRIPCSSSATSQSVTLMRIERSADDEGRADQYLVFPSIRIAQGDVNFDDTNGDSMVRIVAEPNTIISAITNDSAMVFSTTYVLENYAIDGHVAFDFNQPFQLRFDNFFTSGTRQYIYKMPAYNPTTSSYPNAFKPLPINGYMTSDYYDSSHSGEGMFVQVFEQPAQGVYVLQLNWFTYGPDGQPFWISGGGIVQPGTRTLDVDLNYYGNGGFAGDFGAKADRHPWGSMTLQFSDCNHMYFTYASEAGLPASVPQGSGTRTWGRLANVNGLTCE